MNPSHISPKEDLPGKMVSPFKGSVSTARTFGTALSAFATLIFAVGNGYAANVLLNAGFEDTPINSSPYSTIYDNPTNLNGYTNTYDGGNINIYLDSTVGLVWQTTAADDKIELWRNGNTVNGGILAPEGVQFAEVNAFTAATLYQDVTITLAGLVDLSFYHRGRDGSDTLNVAVTYLGPDNAIGGGDDVLEFSQNYTTDNTGWVQYFATDEFTSVVGGVYRFAYTSVSTAGGPAIGNFIDAPAFGVDAVPEPSAALLGLIGSVVLLRRRRN